MKTIAQQLNIKKFPFEIRDKQGNTIYKEWDDGFWKRWEYNLRGQRIYFENSTNYFARWCYDNQGKQIYFENSFWYRKRQPTEITTINN